MGDKHQHHSSRQAGKLWIIFLCIALLLLVSALIPMYIH
jgi:hypothetical protein